MALFINWIIGFIAVYLVLEFVTRLFERRMK